MNGNQRTADIKRVRSHAMEAVDRLYIFGACLTVWSIIYLGFLYTFSQLDTSSHDIFYVPILFGVGILTMLSAKTISIYGAWPRFLGVALLIIAAVLFITAHVLCFFGHAAVRNIPIILLLPGVLIYVSLFRLAVIESDS